MPATNFDAVIIGGGYAGSAVAYRLACRGATVLLLEAQTIGSGASGASAGRAQVSESHRGAHFELVLDGLAQLETLEQELEADFEWRRLGNLMLIERDNHWQWWSEQVAFLQTRRVPAKMLNRADLQKAEPLLNAGKFLGAAWCLEGHLNPLKYCQAFARAARRRGAVIKQHTPVTGFERQGRRITGVHTPSGSFSAGVVLAAAGAWSGKLLQLAGASLPVQFTHAEAFISQPLPRLIHNHVGLADFYETIHTQARAVSVGVAQQQCGTLLVTEAVEMTPNIHRGNSYWGAPAIARDLLALFPALSGARIVRAWAAPSPFLPDEQPAIGPLPDFDNLFVATCFHLTITTIPVLSRMIAKMLVGESTTPWPPEFNPARFEQSQKE